jgi:hypothetical protein
MWVFFVAAEFYIQNDRKKVWRKCQRIIVASTILSAPTALLLSATASLETNQIVCAENYGKNKKKPPKIHQ